MFLSRNYRLIVALRKFDVRKRNIFFRKLAQKSIGLQLNCFPDFDTKAVKAKYKISWKGKQTKPLNTILIQFQLFIFYETYLGGDKPSTIHLRAAEEKQNGFCRYIVTNKVPLWSACVVVSSAAVFWGKHSVTSQKTAAEEPTCVVYTKTIIHLSVG